MDAEVSASPRAPWDLDDGRRIMLITPAELATLAVGTQLRCIDGTTAVVGTDAIDDDTRYGYIAYGFDEPAAAPETTPAPTPSLPLSDARTTEPAGRWTVAAALIAIKSDCGWAHEVLAAEIDRLREDAALGPSIEQAMSGRLSLVDTYDKTDEVLIGVAVPATVAAAVMLRTGDEWIVARASRSSAGGSDANG